MPENKFFIYARKSSDDAKRQVLSIEAQLYELRSKALREGLNVVGEFEESKTAKQPGREQFNEMVKRLRKGEANAIICWKLDRLARNLMDAGEIMNALQNGTLQEIRTHDRVFLPSDNVIYMLVEFGMANQYIRDLSVNVKRGIRHKLRNGIWPSAAPVGYLNDRKTKTIVPDPERARFVRKAFELYATGEYSLQRLSEIVNNLGLKARPRKGTTRLLAPSNYQTMLKNPVYYGAIRYDGEFYDGKHEPLVTKEIFDAVQKVFGNKSKPKSSGFKPFLYRGFFRCGICSCFVTTETQKSHNYLRCTKRKTACPERYVREEVIHDQVAAAIGQVSVPAHIAHDMLKQLEIEHDEFLANTQKTVDQLKLELKKQEAMLASLLDFLIQGVISDTDYKSRKELVLKQKADLYEKMSKFEQEAYTRFEPITEFVNSLKQASFLSLQRNFEENRNFLKKVGSNFTLANQKIAISFKNPWKIVENFNLLPGSERLRNRSFAETLEWRSNQDQNLFLKTWAKFDLIDFKS